MALETSFFRHHHCTESSSCVGWVAALVAAICFGSFGVPVRGLTTERPEAHPLVMQTYKTVVCFATCWLVLLTGEEGGSVRFSWYGVLSGLFWVPGGLCGIYAIRNTGLAVAVGTWSSLNVLSSFLFGILVFHERVRHFATAVTAFIVLIVGLIGMSRYAAAAAPVTSAKALPTTSVRHLPSDSRSASPQHRRAKKSLLQHARSSSFSSSSPVKQKIRSAAPSKEKAPASPTTVSARKSPVPPSSGASTRSRSTGSTGNLAALELEPLFDPEDAIMGGGTATKCDDDKFNPKENLILCGGRLSLTRRQLGLAGATFNGVWGSMNLVPLHFAMRRDGLSGAGYVISYATGSMIVNAAMWILLALYHTYQRHGNWKEGIDMLPSMHWRQLWLPGLLTGLLYSAGNFGNILAVAFLGQAKGFSVCQMQLFVSGLWGVFYFREIRGREIIVKWFLSAAVAVTGIIWLSYEHQGSNSMRH